MTEKIKKIIVLVSVTSAILVAPFNVAYGVYFGVMSNVLINAFWNSKLFPENKIKQKLILESIHRPKF